MTPWWAARRGDRSQIGEDLAGLGWLIIGAAVLLFLAGCVYALVRIWT
jgi:hypothetical protein